MHDELKEKCEEFMQLLDEEINKLRGSTDFKDHKLFYAMNAAKRDLSQTVDTIDVYFKNK